MITHNCGIATINGRHGVYYFGRKESPQFICRELAVYASASTEDGYGWSHVLRFTSDDTGHEHEIVVPWSSLAPTHAGRVPMELVQALAYRGFRVRLSFFLIEKLYAWLMDQPTNTTFTLNSSSISIRDAGGEFVE